MPIGPENSGISFGRNAAAAKLAVFHHLHMELERASPAVFRWSDATP